MALLIGAMAGLVAIITMYVTIDDQIVERGPKLKR